MSSAVRLLSLFWLVAAASTLWAGEAAPSQPSRIALYQRDVINGRSEPMPNAPGPEESLTVLRRIAFRPTEIVVVPPSVRLDLPPAAPQRKDPPAARAIAVSPAQPLPLLGVHPVAPTASASSAERELALQPTSFTPYDRYLGLVRDVIANVHDTDSSVGVACRLMREAHAFRYVAQDPYRANAPAVTAARRAGDCKSKALWLYEGLGDPGALYVIGKITRRAKSSHAWVYWRYQSRWWILDPTNCSTPIAADTVSSGRYVPYYSLGKNGTYRHPATQLLLATAENITGQAPAVAARTVKPKLVTDKRRSSR